MIIKSFVQSIRTVAICGAAVALVGCASIVSGTNQVVSVETLSPVGRVDGASCRLQNDKGVYYVTTPGTVTVNRAYGDMSVKCEKSGLPTGVATIKSSTKAMMAGNIIFGGIIGAGVDAASGAAYDYPAVFQIMMSDLVANALTPVVAAPAAPVPPSTGAMK